MIIYMISHFKKYFILILSITVVSVFLANIFGKKANNQLSGRIDTENFRKVLSGKEIILDSLMKNVAEFSDSVNIVQLFTDKELKEQLSEHSLALLLYQGENLTYWSDNSITFDTEFNDKLFNQKLISYKNSWLLCKKTEYQGNKLIGLILIKSVFEYENKYIENKFAPEFNVPKETDISKTPSSEGYNITDSDNNFLLSLHPNYNYYDINSKDLLSLIFYLIAFAGIVILTLIGGIQFKKIYSSNIWILAAAGDLFLIRWLMIRFNYPHVFEKFDLFKPYDYGSSFWLPSLGDYLLNALCVLVLSVIFFRVFSLSKTGKKYQTPILSVAILFCLVYFFLIISLLKNLILNSSISLEFHNILKINSDSILVIIIFSALILSFLLIIYKLFQLLKENIRLKIMIVLIILIIGAAISITWFSGLSIDLYSTIFLIISCLFLVFFTYSLFDSNLSTLTIFVLLISAFTGLLLNHLNSVSEIEKRKVLIVNLSNERDMIGELQLEEFESKLKEDPTIIEYMGSPDKNQDFIYKHLIKNYFHGYWGKYDLQITPCKKTDSLEIQPSGDYTNCFSFFENTIKDFGMSIPGTNFYFIDNNSGRINYLGKINFTSSQDSSEVILFIDLNSRLINTELGYPELLLEKNLKKSTITDYSYAKYKNNELISQSGEFNYNFSADVFNPVDSNFQIVVSDKYQHLIYKVDSSNIIVMSKPLLSSLDVIVSLSYIFIINFIIILVFIGIRSFPYRFNSFTLKNRIQATMLSLILLSLLIVGGGSVYFNVRQYNNSQYENIIEKTQSVLVEIEHKFGDYKSLKDENPEYINYLLIKFSNVFYSDINLYDLEGNLLSSSRPEIFSKGLLGNKMNPDAYYQLKFNKKSEYIHNEKIGNLNYLSAYIPFRNYMNQEVAYLNLPYFTKQDKLKSEISKLVVAIANSYLILFLITAFLAVLLAKNVTRPLRLIQKKFHEIQLGKQNEKIKYGKKNEIGELVAEYNRMVDELMKSAELLAKSERESAWREMAKQIAHEIKNPLTPMKLSVQHLQRSWQSKDANYDKLQQKVTLTLIEQIDTLSSIATEFSMFANMPKNKNEKINIITKINNTVNLYSDEESPEITIENHGSEEIYVYADKEQIIRVFNNIIKNSIQAIPANRKGLIQIEIVKDQQNVIVSIRDNGAGIEEKLIDKIFEPNFTTKSSGMGLGLAMSRNIIEQSDGKIWFETELNKGTVFYISLPLAEK